MGWRFCLALLAVLASCTAGYTVTAYDDAINSKIGPKECAKGSSYWCQDLLTAKRCGAVKHCIQVVWEHRKMAPDGSDVCQTCKKMVAEARDTLKSNDTQELIKAVLEGTCDIYFPVKILARECIKLVDEFIPEFVEMLASRMDPQTVCSVAWLCNSNKLRQLVEDVKLVKGVTFGSDACQDCKAFVADLIANVKQMGEAEFESRLEQGCSKLPSSYMRTGCEVAVKQDIDEIYNYVVTQMSPPEACAFAAMCVDGMDRVDKKTKSYPSLYNPKSIDPECDFCEQLVKRLRTIIITNSTKDEVRHVLLNVCSQLKSYQDKCTTIVNDYFDEIYNLLVDEMSPKILCTAFGLCSKRKSNAAPWKPRGRFVGDDEDNSIRLSRNKNKNMQLPDLSQKDVKVKLPPQKTIDHPHRPPIPSPTNCNVRLHDKPQCAICEYALHQLQEMLMDNKTEEEIKEAIEKVCSYLPKTLYQQCDAFVTQYGDSILALLAQEIDPSQVCVQLQLCDSLNVTPIEPSPVNTMERMSSLRAEKLQLPLERMFPSSRRLAGTESCLYCQYSMELLHAVLNINGTKETILFGLDNVCHQLPSTWRDRCDAFVDEYADGILTMMQQENLTEICGVLDVCQGGSWMAEASAAAKAAIQHVNSDVCEVCEVTVQMLEKVLGDPSVSGDIVEAFAEVCKFVPEESKPKCQSIVEVYGPYVVQLIGELADPKQVCQAVELCGTAPGQVHLLGGKRCTYGPSYWCKTKFHARACKVEEYCKRYGQPEAGDQN